jgi:hypothetical protein
LPDRKGATLAANTTSVYTHGRALSNSAHTLEAQLKAFGNACTAHAERTRAASDALAERERAALAALDARAAAQTRAAQDALGRARAHDGSGDGAWTDVQAVVGGALSELGAQLAGWAAEAEEGARARCTDLQVSTQEGFASVRRIHNVRARSC